MKWFGQLKNKLYDGYEIWKNSSPRDTWDHLCGSAGVALVRDENYLCCGN